MWGGGGVAELSNPLRLRKRIAGYFIALFRGICCKRAQLCDTVRGFQAWLVYTQAVGVQVWITVGSSSAQKSKTIAARTYCILCLYYCAVNILRSQGRGCVSISFLSDTPIAL